MGVPSESSLSRSDARAYLCIEQARLLCEQAVADVAVGRCQADPGLRTVHRYLGVAGLLVSTFIEPEPRLELLAEARRRCRGERAKPAPRTDGAIEQLERAVRGCRRELERGMRRGGPIGPLAQAKLHLDAAQAALARAESPAPRPVVPVLRALLAGLGRISPQPLLRRVSGHLPEAAPGALGVELRSRTH